MIIVVYHIFSESTDLGYDQAKKAYTHRNTEPLSDNEKDQRASDASPPQDLQDSLYLSGTNLY